MVHSCMEIEISHNVQFERKNHVNWFNKCHTTSLWLQSKLCWLNSDTQCIELEIEYILYHLGKRNFMWMDKIKTIQLASLILYYLLVVMFLLYLPLSTMVPSFITNIWSAWLMVESLWAMTSVVFPWHNSDNDNCIALSVRESNEDVAWKNVKVLF